MNSVGAAKGPTAVAEAAVKHPAVVAPTSLGADVAEPLPGLDLLDHLPVVRREVVAEVFTELSGPLRNAPRVVFVDIRKHRGIAQCVEPGLVTSKDSELRDQLSHMFGSGLTVRAGRGRY